MPAIVLLSKIFYRQDSFKKVINDLDVSVEALKYRLIDLFRFYTNCDYTLIVKVISDYQRGKVDQIFQLFYAIKEKIISQ